MKELWNGIKEKSAIVLFISSGIWALIAHGMALFNKYSFHDDVVAFNGVGLTFSLGRWMLGVLDILVQRILGSRHESTPLICGLLTIVCLTIIMYIFINSMNIKSNVTIVLLSGIMISFPAITGIFGYIYSAPYYYFGALIGVVGAYIFHIKKTIVSGLFCSTLMACSVGVYQPNIPICICALLLFFLIEVCENELEWKEYILLAVKNIVICIAFMAEYFIINKLFLIKFGIKLSNYVNDFGSTDLIGYLLRVVTAYKEFINPTANISGNMYPYAAKKFHIAVIIVLTIMTIYMIISILKKNARKAIEILLIIIIYPLAAYFIYVMVDDSVIHGLMTYGEVLTYVLAAWIIERNIRNEKFMVILRGLAWIAISLVLFSNIRFANICYLKAEILQTQAISYFTTLATDIKTTEGYSDEIPVVYINEYNKSDASLIGANYLFDAIYLPPYWDNSLINDYAWRETMRQWCGFSPIIGDANAFIANEDVQNMPCYPEDGSISNIDGTIVVKFAD